MKYPDLSAIPTSSAIVDGMVAEIAYRERESVSHFPQYDVEYSQRLGQLCLTLEDAKVISDEQREIGEAPAIFTAMRSLIINRDKAADTKRYQRYLHSASIAALSGALKAPNSRRKWGLVAERTCLSLLTRYAHPAMLAYQTLPHHESDTDVSGHFDVGMVISEPDETINLHYLQVKASCLDCCESGDPTPQLPDLLQKYRPSVQLVSSCCHLGIGSIKQQNPDIPNLLLKEYGASVTTKDVKRLDNITDSLIFNASWDLLPRGKAGGKSIPIHPQLFHDVRQKNL